MNARQLLTTLVVCSLAWAVRGCAVAPWEQQEKTLNGTPPPNKTGQKARQHSQPEEKAQLKNSRASQLPRALETKSLPRQQLPPDLASRPELQPRFADRQRIDPDAGSGQRQEAAQELALQPRPAPSVPLLTPEPRSSPAPEPAQEQGPAPEPAQAAQVPEAAQEPASSEALQPPAPQPLAPERAQDPKSPPQPSFAEPASEPVAAPSVLGAHLAMPDLFSPEPISERPTTLFLPDAQGAVWFDGAFEHGRPQEAKIPRLLREPSPPPLRSEEEQ
jgi:hypothetical protein